MVNVFSSEADRARDQAINRELEAFDWSPGYQERERYKQLERDKALCRSIIAAGNDVNGDFAKWLKSLENGE